MTFTIARDSWRCHHVMYSMTCESYDGLWERAGGLCEICRKYPTGKRGLQLDHDHSPPDYLDKVRGLLCPRCNTYVGLVEAGTHPSNERVDRYLTNPWHAIYPPVPRGHQKQADVSNHALLIPRDLWDEAAESECDIAEMQRKWLQEFVEGRR